jgi:hypothetical protein
VGQFDPFNHSTEIVRPLPQEKGIPFNGKWPMADSLYLAQRLSGVHLKENEVDQMDSEGLKGWLGLGLEF